MIAQTNSPESNKMSRNNSRTVAGSAQARKTPSMSTCWAALAWTLLLAAPALAANTGPIISNPPVTNPIGPPTVPPSSFQTGLTNTNEGITETGTGLQQYPSGMRSFYWPANAVRTTITGTSRTFSPYTPKIIGPVASSSAQTPWLAQSSGLTEQAGGAGLYRLNTVPGRPQTSDPSSTYWQNSRSYPIPGTPSQTERQTLTPTQSRSPERLRLQTLQQTGDQQAISGNIEQYRREMLELQQRIEQLDNRVAELTQGLGTNQESPQQPLDTTPRPTVTLGAFADMPLPGMPSQSVLQPPGLPTHLGAMDRGVAYTPPRTIQDPVPTTPTTGLTLYDPRNAMLDNLPAASPPWDSMTGDGIETPGQADALPLEPLPALDAILRAAGSPGITQRPEPVEQVDDLRELIRRWDIQAESLAGQLTRQPQTKSRPRWGLQIWKSPQETADEKGQTTTPKGLSETGAEALKHKTFQSFAKDKFAAHIASAESYMQQGKYYRAAEAYTLAALYKPGDARPHLGKGHALFAAGEYLSSAVYVAKAVEIAPTGTLTGPTDLVRAVGGPAPFEARLTDLAGCAQRSEAPELKFLLAYIHLRIGDVPRAKAALTLTEQHFRAWPAANILRQAVNEAILAPYLK